MCVKKQTQAIRFIQTSAVEVSTVLAIFNLKTA